MNALTRLLLRTMGLLTLSMIGLVALASAAGSQVPCHCVAYTAAGVLDGVGGNTTLRILDLRTGLRTAALFKGNISHVQGLPGEQLAFIEYDNTSLDLFTYATTLDPWSGTVERHLVQVWQRRTAPVWSSDGRYFAYVDDETRLRIVTAATGTEDFNIALQAVPLVWSPDNQQLLYVKSADIIAASGYVSQIHSLNLMTGESVLYFEPPEETFFDYRQFILDWSPDATRIAYSFYDKPHLYDPASTQIEPLSDTQGLTPRWSVRGDLAFFEFQEITTQQLILRYRSGLEAQFVLDDMYFLNHFDWLQP